MFEEQSTKFTSSPAVVEVSPDSERNRQVKEIVQARRQRKCQPTCDLPDDKSLTTATSKVFETSVSPSNQTIQARVVTPDLSPVPFFSETSEPHDDAPFTPIAGYQPVNLRSYQYTGILDDELDLRDKEEPLNVTDYVQEMYAHFREREAVVDYNYIFEHRHVDPQLRSSVIDWIIGMHWRFQLVPEVLYLSVNLLDRFLEKKRNLKKAALDLVGLACLRIASKQEAIYPLCLKELEDACDRVFNGAQIVKMELMILEELQYRIYVPTSFTFLIRYLKAGHANKDILQKSTMILDATLLGTASLCFLPSQLAAGTIFLARLNSGRQPWSPTLLKESLYCEGEIEPVARSIFEEQKSMWCRLQAVQNKYAHVR